MPPLNNQFPPAPVPSQIRRGEDTTLPQANRDEEAALEGTATTIPEVDPIDQANEDINKAVVEQPETPGDFTQEVAPAPNFLQELNKITAPVPFDAAERARQLQQEQGISSLNDQLNLVDSEISEYDIRVRETARQSRNRLAPQSLINRELSQIQQISQEHRSALLSERNFLQDQIASRNNIVNSLVEWEQVSYENALEQYNTNVNLLLQKVQLEAQIRSQNLEIESKERQYARAQGEYVLDIILNAAQQGADLSSIPQGLVDNLSQLSETAWGDPDFYSNLADYMVSQNLFGSGDSEEGSDYRILGVTRLDDGTYQFVLYDQHNIGNTKTIPVEGTLIQSGGSPGGITTIPGTRQLTDGDSGTKTFTAVTTDGTPISIDTRTPNDAPDQESPERDTLRGFGVETIPTWVPNENLVDALAFITGRPQYSQLNSLPEGTNKQNSLRDFFIGQFNTWLLGTYYSNAVSGNEGADLVIGEGSLFSDLNRYGLPQNEFENILQGYGRSFLREFTLLNTKNYQNGTQLLDDIRERPSYFSGLFRKFYEVRALGAPGSAVRTLPSNRLPGATTEPTIETTQEPGATGTGERVTLTNGRTVSLAPRAARQRDQVTQVFGVELADDALAIIDRESKGDPEALNTSGEYSVGLFQINLQFRREDGSNEGWQPEIRQLMGQPNATRDDIRTWLENPVNNIRAAQLIYSNRGNWSAWTTAGPLGLV